MKNNIKKILDDKGKSINWLSKEIGMTYTNTFNLVKNKSESIKLNTIEKICNVLECDPNSLFELDNKQ